MKKTDGTIRIGVKKIGDEYLPWFETVEEAIDTFRDPNTKQGREKPMEYYPYMVGDTRYENIYGMDYEMECNSCRKVRFITNRSNRHWTQCKACQDKYRFKVILHYKDDLDVMIDAFSHPIPRDSNGNRFIGLTVVGKIETEDEAAWLWRLGSSLPLSYKGMHNE